MNHRRVEAQEDSLELLLDTISNAFGGVLFLTILLALLLRISRPKTEAEEITQPARHELVEQSSQLDEVLGELQSLEAALAVQNDVRGRLVDPDLQRRFAELVEQRERSRTLEQGVLRTKQEIAAEQREVESVTAESQELDKQLVEAEDAEKKAQTELTRERSKRTQSVVPPRTRSTSKLECPLVVRYGRIYANYRMGENAFTRELNLHEFVVLGEADGRLRLTPKPTAGLRIDESDAFLASLRQKLAANPPQLWYVCLIVWEDSFDQFQVLKRRLIDAGYELRLLPIPFGGEVIESHVPDPQVQ